MCVACGNLVDGDGVKMKGEEKVYHTHCLTCSSCTNTIEGKFFTLDGKVVCDACAKDQVKTLIMLKSCYV